MWIALIIVLVPVFLISGLSFYLAGFAMKGKRQTPEESRAWQEKHYDLSWYDSAEKTEYTVNSYDGYALHALFLKNPENTSRYVLISHGYTDNRFGAMKYAPVYLELGFNIIAYDLRGHGVNAPAVCTYTVRERKDLLAMIRDSVERYPDRTLFGIHGESLGAATTVAVLEENPPVDFAVADCGFCDIVPVLKAGLKAMHLPGFLAYTSSLCAKVRYGWSFRQMRPVDCLGENRIPILFIHGEADDFILPDHSERMKAATKGYAELHLIPGAGHARSVLTDPDSYKKYTAEFLDRLFPGWNRGRPGEDAG